MSYQLELRHLRYFLAVAEELHFRKAAERLFISQPGLSKQIKELEQHLDLQLFDRHNRKVALTPAGAYLKKELSHYFNGLEQIIEHSKLLDRGIVGNLKLGYVGSAMQQIIPDLLLAFRNLHPKILFSLKEMDNQKQIDNLQMQEIDIGFVRLERVPNDLEITPIEEDTFSLVLPVNHPLNSDNFTDLSQLKNESFIMFDPSITHNFFPAHIVVGAYTLYCRLTKVFMHIATGAFPFT